ncbi:zona pellucida sperm-binding protein 3-like isoform X1 [Erpetoichthys calabaricus]|uniref:zona pellucida sperm-binding protein 3-like isoform X1 n=1 Tax=Erpetoichthys calabaricus TaxID=27687 RepID=UPI00223426F9|nr:zona pellucida sperm-binding protein 3-like isoform X1 [Erpetoichthys calabaricus]
MGCKAACQLLIAFGVFQFYCVEVSAAVGYWRSGLRSKVYKAIVTPSETLAQQRAGSPETVSAQCTEWDVMVTINPDLLGIQHPVQASDLTIGGCGVTSQTPTAFVIEAPLQGCGSNVTMVSDEIVYYFTLDYNPSPIPGLPIVRTNPAVVQIECHYPRNHNVSSNALNPTWVPYTSTISAQDVLGFSLIIMNSDWSGPSSSNVFYLGDLINLQASVDSTNHVPLLLFVDNCVASSASNGSAPIYTFIGNNGCFTDSKVTGSNSQFITPRIAPSILQFELDAFRFYGVATSSVFITCRLKVTLASQAIDNLNKACTYITGLSQWTSVDGSNQVCSCCDANCATGQKRRIEMARRRPGRSVKTTPVEWEKTLVVGPLFLEGKHHPAVSEHLTATEAKPAGSFMLVLGSMLVVLALTCSAFLLYLLYQKPQISN